MEDKAKKQPQKKTIQYSYPVKQPLTYPIETKDGQKLTELTLNRLTIGDFESVSEEVNKQTRSVKLLALSASLSVDDIRRIDYDDFAKSSDLVADFMGF